jgi:hypothetical protein
LWNFNGFVVMGFSQRKKRLNPINWIGALCSFFGGNSRSNRR